MTVKRMRWMAAVGMALTAPCLIHAQEGVWRAVARTPPPPAVVASSHPSVAAPPIATLGKPVPLAAAAPVVQAPAMVVPAAAAPLARGGQVAPVQYRPAAVLAAPTPAVIRAQAPPDPDPLTWSSPSGVSQNGVTTDASQSARATDGVTPAGGSEVGTAPPQPDPGAGATTHTASGPSDPPPPIPPAPSPPDVVPGAVTDRSVAPAFWEKCKGWMQFGDKGGANGRGAFQSDNAFNGLISPVSNPFFFEDPRSLTEVRPIFMWQGVPSKSPYQGGDAFFFGTQARVAFTERFSVVMNELGFVSLDPSHPGPVTNNTGFAEIKIGPKYTFLRNCQSGTVAAAGLTFEIPMGDKTVFQNTGTLGLDPYVTIGQTFGKLPNGFGTINLLGEAGYSFATDDNRAQFFHASMHIDYNIANTNKFYPLLEFNWLHYTTKGKNTDIAYEGADLINFGAATRQGSDYFTTAVGMRYRFTDCIFAGAAIEFPLAVERGNMDYRLTFDMIFRY